jgi:hypothetical protein
MKRKAPYLGLVLCLAGGPIGLTGQTAKMALAGLRLNSAQGLEAVNAKAVVETYRGRRAVHLAPLPDHPEDYSMLAIVSGTDFKDGTIEIDVAGAPGKDADPGNRGFIGILFRAEDHGSRAEHFYLRPTNGRSDDQLRRNHSVQYESIPDFSWKRLRAENPGVYESYADIQPGVWTKMKIVVSGAKAQLYVNGAAQPCLVVNDLRLGASRGHIALWVSGGADGYFSNLKVR